MAQKFTPMSGTADLRKFISTFPGKFPKDLQREIRPLMRKIGGPALAAAKRNASWSRRIPAATKLSVSLTKRGAGMKISTSRKAADHAHAFEHKGQPGMFRHPVNKRKTVWVNQRARPFQWPAVQPITKSIDKEIGAMVDHVSRAHGFK